MEIKVIKNTEGDMSTMSIETGILFDTLLSKEELDFFKKLFEKYLLQILEIMLTAAHLDLAAKYSEKENKGGPLFANKIVTEKLNLIENLLQERLRQIS